MSTAVMKETRTNGGGMKAFFSKLSRGLMLPIAMLPIAGLFLGVGAGFENVVKQAMAGQSDTAIAQASFVFTVFKSIGDVIFGNLPTLFCLGVAVAFAEDAGVAVFSALVGWIVFNATQSTMIWDGTIHWVDNANVSLSVLPDGANHDNYNKVVETYNILWWKDVPTSVVGSNVGLTSMQTSVFGGITIGLFVAFLYNKFHTFQMPKVLGFFSGTRFVPIITFLTVPLIGFFFLMIWPLAGMGLEQLGIALGKAPTGVDSFVFGVVERSLIPFGLHHAFYTPLWYTSAGGQLLDSAGKELAAGNQNIWFAMQSAGIPFTVLDGIVGGGVVNGWHVLGTTEKEGFLQIVNDQTSAKYFLTDGVNPGNYMQGKFPFMLLGLPAAGAAMIMAAKKENREVAMSVIGAAAITSFLTGITEPIEFTFLFLAPILYYGFHIWMAGISFMLLDVLGTHVGMTFSGGIFDYVLFGIIPDASGLGSNSFWIIPVAIVYAPIYYFVFYFYITKFDVKTPGRDGSGEVKLVSKAEYKASKEGKTPKTTSKAKWAKNAEREARVLELEANLGGLENLETIDACITRLRITVVDPSKVNYEAIKAMGAAGIVGEGKKAQQHIFGAEADQFKTELKALKASRK